MVKKSLSLAAFLSRRGAGQTGFATDQMAPRPKGTVVWVWAADLAQLIAIDGLAEELAAEGEPITFVTTLPSDVPLPVRERLYVAPDGGRNAVFAFLAHWRPSMVLWVGDRLDPAAIAAINAAKIPAILIEAKRPDFHQNQGLRVPWAKRAMLQSFGHIVTVDDSVTKQIVKIGVPNDRVTTAGHLEPAPRALTHFEDERQDLATRLGTRPVWFAADTDRNEASILAKAHHQASLRAHRLMLILSLKQPEEGPDVAADLRRKGFNVALRSADEEPNEATQIYVADTDGELGLWYRIAPITFLGGSLSGGAHRNPFEAATLGSAVMHGPDIAPFESQIARLNRARACLPLNRDGLGDAIERLLSPDSTATMVHAAWDVTSRGAEVTSIVAELILKTLDDSGA